ncbi:MAG: ArgE/DapE family deacylase, partial [Candidatus Thorarchaeota archaeon]
MTNEQLKNSSREWIRANHERLSKLTQGLVRIPSISGNELKVQEFIHKVLTDMKLKPEMIYPDLDILRKDGDYFETTSFSKVGYEQRPNVAATLNGSGTGRSICLTGHVDVVSPEPLEDWTRDPWGGEIEDDLLYGRG